MAFQTLAFLGFLALTVLLCHALGRVRPSLGRTALLLGWIKKRGGAIFAAL